MPRSLPVTGPQSPGSDEPLHLSGILVRVTPSDLPDVLERLGQLPGVRVHQRDEASGKVVVTHEGDSRKEAETALQRIRSLPGVHLAEPVYHYVEPGSESCEDQDGGGGS